MQHTTTLDNLESGEVKITITLGEVSVWGFVSSHHLVPTKEAQLLESALSEAAARNC
jgi:hypothetical protein